VLSRSPPERGGKAFCDAEQSDRHLARCWNSREALEPLLKVETIMRALCTGQGRGWERRSGSKTQFYPHLHALMTKELHTRPPMLPPAPILPEDGEGPDDQWMQEHTHLTRLRGGAAIPLTRLSQGTGTATADTGGIDHAQAAIGFPALLVCRKSLTCWTTQRPIRLEGKILPREAARASCAERLLLVRTPEQEPARGTPCVQLGALEQTRWCAAGQDEADGPTPDGGSRSIG
jgi:hypothetical protein